MIFPHLLMRFMAGLTIPRSTFMDHALLSHQLTRTRTIHPVTYASISSLALTLVCLVSFRVA